MTLILSLWILFGIFQRSVENFSLSSREEQALLESVENDEWVSVKNKESEINRYTEIVKATFKKDKRVSATESSLTRSIIR